MKKLIISALLLGVAAAPMLAQDTANGRGRGAAAGRRGGGGRPWMGPMDSTRARELYVSRDPGDLRGCSPQQCERDIERKRVNDSIYTAHAPGNYEFQKIKYKSRPDGLEIPAYLYSPINKGSAKHPVLVWVHQGLHADWDLDVFPWVIEAVKQGYVVLAPDYRGSTGYGDEWMRKIDYGGKEVDDVLSSVDYLATLPYVDMKRLGIIGFSHGGFITAHILFRADNPFKAGAAMVPVTNLIFRLSDHGPGYARDYAAEEGIHGMPWESGCGEQHDRSCIDVYMERSPVFHVENLKVPILVHVATNDCDVFFRENQQMVYTLRALKPELAETKIYVNPPPGRSGCGHTFSRRVNPETLARDDSPEQIDSWNRVWGFFRRNLK
ncbi:MAG TPA: alpha/beta fold hydrolase [Gemmatimonadaceae bacterium]|nr:alpha/beta fold hydrolase [Gemmatimonadaceae bacterium]